MWQKNWKFVHVGKFDMMKKLEYKQGHIMICQGVRT